jgi:prepilin-type N-terminal cleavage/methylation domain-containing protein
MTTIRKPASRRAFTLLEIMLAVTIMTMVVTVVYSTWNVAFKSWRRSSEITESLQRQRIVMGVLTDLTSSAVYFGSDTKMYGVLGYAGMAAKRETFLIDPQGKVAKHYASVDPKGNSVEVLADIKALKAAAAAGSKGGR